MDLIRMNPFILMIPMIKLDILLWMVSICYCMERVQPLPTRDWSPWKKRLIFNRLGDMAVDLMLEYVVRRRLRGKEEER